MTETFIHDEDLDLNDFTPAMRQFIEVKRRYPETLVLFRMGDFYETFFDDAAKANRLIGITLTKRGKLKNGDPIPMAGIPMVSLDQYVARLVRLGESVVIAEQLGTPSKGLMERRISRIITPGTLTDTSLLPEKDDAVLLSVSRPAGKNAVWGFAWLTLSNGDFFATEVTDEQFDSEVARISPSEVLVSEKLRDAMRETHPELTVTPMPAWHFDAEHGEEALKKTFGLDNLDAWGVTGKTGVLAAANALLDYTAETQVDMIPFISPLKLTDESEYIIIDPASRRNLEISDTIRSEGRGPTLFSVLDRCGTSMGSRELRRWLNLPLTKADEARGRHDALEALAENQDFSSFVETRLQGLPDIEPHRTWNGASEGTGGASRRASARGRAQCRNRLPRGDLVRHDGEDAFPARRNLLESRGRAPSRARHASARGRRHPLRFQRGAGTPAPDARQHGPVPPRP